MVRIHAHTAGYERADGLFGRFSVAANICFAESLGRTSGWGPLRSKNPRRQRSIRSESRRANYRGGRLLIPISDRFTVIIFASETRRALRARETFVRRFHRRRVGGGRKRGLILCECYRILLTRTYIVDKRIICAAEIAI